MLVKELIKALESQPQDMEVCMDWDDGYCNYETRSIRKGANILDELYCIRHIEGYPQENIKTFIKKVDKKGLVSWKEIPYEF